MPQLSPDWEASQNPTKKKKGMPALTLAIALGVCGLGFVCLMPALLFPIFMQAREAAQNQSCVRNLKSVARANLMYAADFDDRFPGEGWTAGIKPYIDNEKELSCPAQGKHEAGMPGYALSKQIARKKLDTVTDQKKTVLAFDADTEGNTTLANTDALPRPGRHQSGAHNNVAFVDGHVRAVPVGEFP